MPALKMKRQVASETNQRGIEKQSDNATIYFLSCKIYLYSYRLPFSSASIPSAQLAAASSFDEIIVLDVPAESVRPENVMGIATEPVVVVAEGSATHLPTPFDDISKLIFEIALLDLRIRSGYKFLMPI